MIGLQHVVVIRLLVAALAFVMMSVPGNAANRMCALRSGPEGPCTCRTASDGPGQFTIVAKSNCRSALRPKNRAKARETRRVKTATDHVKHDTAGLVTGSLPAAVKTLDAVRTRGRLLCGVNTDLLGFARRSATGEWVGLDADFCRAVAAAALGDSDKVEFVPLDTTQRFEALKSGKVDLLSRNTTWNMEREVELAMTFAGVLFFDGQSFMIDNSRGLVSTQQLDGATVCAESATTSETNMSYYFRAHNIKAETKTFSSREDLVKAYLAGECDAISGDRSSLFASRAEFPQPENHSVLPEVISKEPLGPAVRQDDREWLEIVKWTLAALINAEEIRLGKAAASDGQPLSNDGKRLADSAAKSGKVLRLDNDWLIRVIRSVGNYGEMFDASIGKASPLGMDRGMNALWKNGGILYAPPMW